MTTSHTGDWTLFRSQRHIYLEEGLLGYLPVDEERRNRKDQVTRTTDTSKKELHCT